LPLQSQQNQTIDVDIDNDDADKMGVESTTMPAANNGAQSAESTTPDEQ
jgi:hypothetical protein